MKDFILGLLVGVMLYTFYDKCIVNNEKCSDQEIDVLKDDNKIALKDSLYTQLVNSVDAYIKSVSGDTSKVTASILIDKSIEYDIDLVFAISQAQLESHFGTRGISYRTNSVFNLMAYDGRTFEEISDLGKYNTVDDSIEPYMKTLKSFYLVDGKTEYDLMNNYVNDKGKRYASDLEYEKKLKKIYIKISNSTDIKDLYNKYKSLS